MDTYVVASADRASDGHHGHSSPRGDAADNLIAFDWQSGGDVRHNAGPLTSALQANQTPPVFGLVGDVATVDFRNITSATNRTRVESGLPANTLHVEGLSAVLPTGVRRLTPLECERLQSWPDGWTQYTDDGREIPDSQRYKLIGNGVVSTVACWIGHRLLLADAVERAA